MVTYIVIPAYNEEKSIALVIENLLQNGYSNVVIVNDGSTDRTAETAAGYPVHVVSHIINLGQGAALQTGNEYALAHGAQAIVHFDADGQHQVQDIEKFIAQIEQGNDIVFGSRYLNHDSTIPWTKRYLIHAPGIMVERLFTGLRLTDVHNGFRALNARAAQAIKITQNQMAHASEIPAQTAKNNLRYAEVPITVIYNEYGQSWRAGIKIVVDLIKQKLFD